MQTGDLITWCSLYFMCWSDVVSCQGLPVCLSVSCVLFMPWNWLSDCDHCSKPVPASNGPMSQSSTEENLTELQKVMSRLSVTKSEPEPNNNSNNKKVRLINQSRMLLLPWIYLVQCRVLCAWIVCINSWKGQSSSALGTDALFLTAPWQSQD